MNAPDSRLMGFVVGRYFAGTPDKPDYMAIDANIREAVGHAVTLWKAGYLLFVPHLNTHHFEMKTGVGEPMYQAFDRRVLRACDFVFATPNWRASSGGRKEIMLAHAISKPIFESVRDLNAWVSGAEPYSTVQMHGAPPAEPDDDRMKIALIEGPYATTGALPPIADAELHARIAEVEKLAVRLWNAGIPCFTPHLNAGWSVSGHHIGEDQYQATKDDMLRKLADCVVLAAGWENDASCRHTIRLATTLGKPVFVSVDDAVSWRDRAPAHSLSTI